MSHSAKVLPALRRGRWKILFGPGSGGWSKGGDAQPVQLYDLASDLGETTNLSAKRSELNAELTALMEQIVADGRSTVGAAQQNHANLF